MNFFSLWHFKNEKKNWALNPIYMNGPQWFSTDSNRRKLNRLEEEQQHKGTRLEELKSQAVMLEEDLTRLSSSNSRITSHVNQQNATTRKRLQALKDNSKKPVK